MHQCTDNALPRFHGAKYDYTCKSVAQHPQNCGTCPEASGSDASDSDASAPKSPRPHHAPADTHQRPNFLWEDHSHIIDPLALGNSPSCPCFTTCARLQPSAWHLPPQHRCHQTSKCDHNLFKNHMCLMFRSSATSRGHCALLAETLALPRKQA